MYRKTRGSARIILAGGGLLALLIVIAIIAHLGGESAETSVETKQRVEETIKEKIQKPLDDRGRMYSKMFEGSFDVILEDVGQDRIAVIKVVRSLKKVGLKEAEELVESAPVTALTGMTKIEAQNAKRQLEQAGATVKIDKRSE